MKKITSPEVGGENEKKEENNIRPSRLDDFVGQEILKQNLKIMMNSAKKRGEPIDHILLSGPPGLGKTTVANIMASEMGVNLTTVSGPTLKSGLELLSILASLKRQDMLFIDEIHRMSKSMEEILYPAMEDFEVFVTLKDGKTSKSKKMRIAPFTLIGATTKSGLLNSPFRDRFGYSKRLELYSFQELEKVIERSAKIIGISLTEEATLEIAKRSRGTPRIANRLLRRVRDYFVFSNDDNNDNKGRNVTLEHAVTSLNLLGLDEYGLDDVDKKILNIIGLDYEGGPVGLKTVSISLGEDIKTIEEVYEPYLVQIGFLKRTSQGRSLTVKAKKYLGFTKKNIKLVPKEDVRIET